jgi:pimeloyl-ACP methyl ester carboxylesterase
LLWGVQAVQLPLTLLAEDVAWTRHVLAERLPGPTVLAGHSYGGAVISGAATGVEKVIGLVFASAVGVMWLCSPLPPRSPRWQDQLTAPMPVGASVPPYWARRNGGYRSVTSTHA